MEFFLDFDTAAVSSKVMDFLEISSRRNYFVDDTYRHQNIHHFHSKPYHLLQSLKLVLTLFVTLKATLVNNFKSKQDNKRRLNFIFTFSFSIFWNKINFDFLVVRKSGKWHVTLTWNIE